MLLQPGTFLFSRIMHFFCKKIENKIHRCADAIWQYLQSSVNRCYNSVRIFNFFFAKSLKKSLPVLGGDCTVSRKFSKSLLQPGAHFFSKNIKFTHFKMIRGAAVLKRKDGRSFVHKKQLFLAGLCRTSHPCLCFCAREIRKRPNFTKNATT